MENVWKKKSMDRLVSSIALNKENLNRGPRFVALLSISFGAVKYLMKKMKIVIVIVADLGSIAVIVVILCVIKI